MKFILICKRCLQSSREGNIINDCIVDFDDASVLFTCQQCGTTEVLEEDTSMRREELMREKRKIQRQLKRKLN